MPPKLVSDDGRYVVIRPLAYCKESDLAQFAVDQAYPIIPCHLCGSQPNLKRAEIKAMIADWEKRYPGRVDNLARGLQNVVPSHLLDPELYPFESPSPDELLQFRRDHPLDDASDSQEALAEADLNPWVTLPEDRSQIIQTSCALSKPHKASQAIPKISQTTDIIAK